MLVTTTNAFDKADLVGGDGTASSSTPVPDNLANIPADRYRQADGSAAGRVDPGHRRRR